MTFNQFIAEFKVNNALYYSSGIVDETSLYTWIFNAFKPLGALITTLQEDFVEVKNKKAILPMNFHEMKHAFRCVPCGYYTDKENEKELQNTLVWTERSQSSFKWELCDKCYQRKEDNVIIEKTYVRGFPVEFYYKGLSRLYEKDSVQKKSILDKYRNCVSRSSENEIKIQGKTLYTNFVDGFIYFQYKGLPKDDEGNFLIPESDLGRVEKYIFDYVHYKFYEFLFKNTTDEKVTALFKKYENDMYISLQGAKNELKMQSFKPKNLQKYKLKNRLDTLKFEI